jgi:predicted short-subunit dehydrogenase-like oxidoreductase (DUF2520 family)
MVRVRVVGAGRAGASFARALAAAGVEAVGPLRHGDDLSDAGAGVDVVLLCVPDRAVVEVARQVDPSPGAVLCHCSGALGLDVLAPHDRRASLHPLATLPDPVVGAARLRAGTYFAVDGDPVAAELALALGGTPVAVAEGTRPLYHAAACIAANHLVALLGQVERVAAEAGLPLAAFLPLARGALDDVALLGPRAALTGPVARGDEATLDRHRAVLPRDELAGYEAGVVLARRLAASSSAPRPPRPGQPGPVALVAAGTGGQP